MENGLTCNKMILNILRKTSSNMSIKIMSRVWSESKQEGGNLLVALALADFANDDGVCWAKNDTIAEKSRLSERQVQRAISDLIRVGEIEKISTPNGQRNCNTYRFMWGDILTGDTHVVSGTTPMTCRSIIDEPSVEPRVASDKPPRPRNALMDEFAIICGHDPLQATKGVWGEISKALKDIRAVCPSVDGAELRRRAGNYRMKLKNCELTPSAIAKWWDKLDKIEDYRPQIHFVN